MGQKSYFTYILANRRQGSIYVGVTNDLHRRVAEHRRGEGIVYTRRYRIHRLVHVEEFSDVQDAIEREKRLKRWRRAWKDELIEAQNPDWRDLARDWS